MHWPVRAALLGVAALILLPGCASIPPEMRGDAASSRLARQLRGLDALERRESLTWDVTKRTLAGRPWLGANDEVRFRLDALRRPGANDAPDPAEAGELLAAMASLANESHRTSMLGLPMSAAERESQLQALARLQEWERGHLPKAGDRRATRRWAARLLGALPPSDPNGGGAGRMALGFPAVPFLYLWIWRHVESEDKGPYPHDFEDLRIFAPPAGDDSSVAAEPGSATDDQLLRTYAPIIVQQVDPAAEYSTDVDRIGAPSVRITPRGQIEAWVDPSKPVVLARVSRSRIGQAWHKQLNYSIWYPEHPPMKSGDPEAGHTEGVLLRLTLDEAQRPILAETCFACGCFHRVFPVEALERAATEQFGRIESGRSPLGRKQPFQVDAIIPQSMGHFTPESPHPVMFVYSGKHFAGAVEFGGYHGVPGETVEYTIAPEASIEALPLGAGIAASFFARDGLVRGADRPEATMLYPTGFYHAGTPRIHDAHLIHFDQYDYNDPGLLEKLLRLPSLGGVLRDSLGSPYSHPAGVAPKPHPREDNSPRAKKKAFFCPC